MLEHALRINAREQYQRIISAITPHLSQADRQDVINNYIELMKDEDEENAAVPSDIIKNDREQLRNLLKKVKNGGQNRKRILRSEH